MSSMEEMMEKYVAKLEEIKQPVDTELLTKVAKGLGPANYNADAQTVAATDEEEVARVWTNWVADELGQTDKDAGMESIHKVLGMFDSSDSKKYRAVVYYLLAKHYNVSL